jgi:hypothetical protein
MSPRPPKKELVALYLRYRSLVDGLKDLPNATQVTEELEPLLITITQAWHADTPLPVRKLLIREALGSPATIHKRIHQLHEAGLVSLDAVASDARVKLVVPTDHALRYLAEKGKAVQLANR